jgi:hypothetical protein
VHGDLTSDRDQAMMFMLIFIALFYHLGKMNGQVHIPLFESLYLHYGFKTLLAHVWKILLSVCNVIFMIASFDSFTHC